VPKEFLKSAARGIALAFVAAPAALTGFGRWHGLFTVFAHSYAVAPGIVGDYLRAAYYRLTLDEFAPSSRISFGSFFSTPNARVEPEVYIGSYCILGRVTIGRRTQIASGVQILSGARQHSRDAGGQITGSDRGVFENISVGADCWLGAAAIVMADLGFGTTIGAGSVVTRPIPAQVVAVGSPARVVREA
jgi:acetyltransferase-like isoleucine patch superfamily enzyme